VFLIMTDKRASDLTAPLLSEDETIVPTPHTSTHDRPDDLAPHRAFGPGRPGNLLVRPEGAAVAGALLRREAVGTQQLAKRLLAQIESQDILFGELRKTIGAIESEAGQVSSVALQRLARTAHEALGWCDAVLLELEAEGRRAAAGVQAIDLLDLVHDTLHDLSIAGFRRVTYVGGHANSAVWASVPVLGRAVRLAVELVDARIDSAGGIHVEIGEDGNGHFVRVEGNGEVTGEPALERIEEFRDAVEAASLRVVPDERSKGRSGLELRFPADARGPLLPDATLPAAH
jgi:hypothetical protein